MIPELRFIFEEAAHFKISDDAFFQIFMKNRS